MGLKAAYNNKKGFFRDDLGISKDNISTWGLKSLHRGRKGHKYVINHVW